jgi:hypothetical protein
VADSEGKHSSGKVTVVAHQFILGVSPGEQVEIDEGLANDLLLIGQVSMPGDYEAAQAEIAERDILGGVQQGKPVE